MIRTKIPYTSRVSNMLAAFVFGALVVGQAMAQDGYDLYTTVPAQTDVILPPPLDELGPIPMQGNPGPVENRFKELEGTNVDTIVKRVGGGGPGETVPIELVALSLRSVDPVHVELPPESGNFFDIYIDVTGGSAFDCEGVPCPGGAEVSYISINADLSFNSFLTVLAELRFVNAMDGSIVGDPQAFVEDFATIYGALASDQPSLRDPRNNPQVAAALPAGSFYPGVNPADNSKIPVQEVGLTANHGLIPANTAGPSVLTCFYECKDTAQAADTRLQETTTLMIVNQNPEDSATPVSHLAHLVFFDGNENALGRAEVFLSGDDIDEVNVCSTLNNVAPYEGPAAGLVKIAVEDRRAQTDLPTADPARVGDGVVAWVKNVLGRQDVGNPEPFVSPNIVFGVGRTRCKAADPDVVDASFVIDHPSSFDPTIDELLIENTGNGETDP